LSGNTVDVVVIGGGVVGLAVADALLQAGLSVTSCFPPVSDRVPVASLAAGAMLGAFGEVSSEGPGGGGDGPAFRFRLKAQRNHPAWLKELEERSGQAVHHSAGTFVVANNVGVAVRSSVKLMKRLADLVGEPATYVEPEDVPGLRPNQYYAPGLCLHLANEHSLDADEMLAVLRAVVGSSGRWRHLAELVARAEPDGTGWKVTTTGGRVVCAQHVVVAAGSRSWDVLSQEIRDEAGLPELYFGKGVSCIVSGMSPLRSTIRTPNRAFACGIHVVPRRDGRLYLGATNNLGLDHEAERKVQPGELHNLFDELIHQINTDLRVSQIDEVRVGFRPILAHGRPVAGTTPVPGLSVATGTYRDGMLMAPLIASIVRDGVLTGRAADDPFLAPAGSAGSSDDALIRTGIRDIVSFLQDPRGELPYDRAEQLRSYLAMLFRVVVDDDGRYEDLRAGIRDRLRSTPLNETMHKIFYELIDHDRREGSVESDLAPPQGPGVQC
jgi:glycine oxidase